MPARDGLARFATIAWLPLVAALLAGCDRLDDEDADEEDTTAQAAPAPTPPAPARTTSGPKSPVRMQAIDLIDEQGLGRPMPAVALQAPADWRWQGGVRWDRSTECIGNQVRVEWQARSPDGAQALELMHAFSWQVAGRSVQMNPCPVLPFASTRAFLEAVVQQRRPGARILEYRERPDLARAAAEEAARYPQPTVPMKRHHDAGEVLIALNADGRTMHEVLATSVTFTEIQGSAMGSSGAVIAQRAPEGRLNPALGQAVAASIRPHPEWLATMTQTVTAAENRRASAQRDAIDRWHNAEMARINAQGAADRAAIRAQTQRDIARIQSETYANTQATNDRMHRRNLEGIGEYNTYRDSSGNTVRSSIHGGDRVFRHPDGSYSSTRDPYLQPPGAEELKRQR